MQVMQQQQPTVDWLNVAEVSERLINLGKGNRISKQEETCAICLTPYLDAALTLTPCKHIFHQHCFHTMVQQHLYTCPLCRFNLKPMLEKVRMITQELLPQPQAQFFVDAEHQWLYILANDDLSFNDLMLLLHILQRHQFQRDALHEEDDVDDDDVVDDDVVDDDVVDDDVVDVSSEL